VNIGTHQPTTWQGFWPTPFLRTNSETVAGVNGKTTIIDAWDSEDARIETFLKAQDQSAKDLELENIQKIQGTVQVVVDQFGISRGDCLILSASSEVSETVDGKYEIRTQFIIQPDPTKLQPDGWTGDVQ
jgi:hypothetical protein